MAWVFGVMNFGLALISMANHMPKPPDQFDTSFRIHIALQGRTGPFSAGGDLPDILVWNEVGDYLGSHIRGSNMAKIDSGSFRDMSVRLSRREQPTYALFRAHDDAICIAYITNTWAGGQQYGWLGHWAETCGRAWYFSNVIIDGMKLNCAWIDKNGDQPFTAIQIHLYEFSNHTGSATKGANYFCAQNPSLIWYTKQGRNQIEYWPMEGQGVLSQTASEPGSTIIKRPQGPPRRRGRSAPRGGRTLVRSSHAEHSATRLCGSASSSGPDLVSLREAKFCDMTTRRVLPLCGRGSAEGKEEEGDCFDDAAKALRRRTAGPVPRGEHGLEKRYLEVLEWGEE